MISDVMSKQDPFFFSFILTVVSVCFIGSEASALVSAASSATSSSNGSVSLGRTYDNSRIFPVS